MPNGNREQDLSALAANIADGKRIDWTEAESSASGTPQIATVRQLRALDVVATFHRHMSLAIDSERLSPPRQSLMVGRGAETGPTLEEPRRWGHLDILAKIGEGAYGEVFLAWDPKLSRQVALKLLRDTSDTMLGSAVIREASMMARVAHQNVVTIYGADLIDGQVGIWMEFIRGRTLKQILTTSGPFGPRETALIGVELCRAVGAVHRAGLVHRDLKAQNVMREWGGRLVLMDFGTGHESADEQNLVVAEILGTPLYAAPEVLDGNEATPSSDIYSLGVLLFHLLTGAYPITGRTLEEIRRAHWAGRGKLLRDMLPDLPAGLSLAIDGALQPKPSERHASASAMESQLAPVLAGPYVGETERLSPCAAGGACALPAMKRRWLFLSAIAAAVLCAVTAATVLAMWPTASRVATKLVVPLAPAAHLKEDPAFDRPLSTALTVSPNGNRIAFVGQTGLERQIYVRHLTESTAELLDETDGATSPAFSPDGTSLAFVTGNLIRKVPSTGGEAMTICEVTRRVRPPGAGSVVPRFAESDVYGLTWRDDTEIVFGRFAGGSGK